MSVLGSYAGATLIVLGFAWLLLRLKLVRRARRVNGLVRQSTATLTDRSLSDDAKEAALRRSSVALFGLFATLTFGLAAAVGLPILFVWLLAQAEIWSFEGALAATLSWPMMVFGLGTFIAALCLGGRNED